MPITPTLELNSLHVTPADGRILNELGGYAGGHPPPHHPFTVHTTATGWIVRAQPFDEARSAAARELGLSEHFVNVVRCAEQHGAALIRLDDSAAFERGLPTFGFAHKKPGPFTPPMDQDVETPVGSEPVFHHTTIAIEVLSEDPVPAAFTVHQVLHEIQQGDYVGRVTRKGHPMTSFEAARKTREFGSDPAFFEIDDEGRPLEEGPAGPRP